MMAETENPPLELQHPVPAHVITAEDTLTDIARAIEAGPVKVGRFSCQFRNGWWTVRVAYHDPEGRPRVSAGLDKVMSAAILEAVRGLPRG
jgi:hypothetical protein